MKHCLYLNSSDVDGVISGSRKHAMVRSRSFDVRCDDRLQLYRNEYFAPCIRHTRCDQVRYLYIGSNKAIIIDERVLCKQESDAFAQDLGFYDYADFFEKFKLENKLPFEGQVVKWL